MTDNSTTYDTQNRMIFDAFCEGGRRLCEDDVLKDMAQAVACHVLDTLTLPLTDDNLRIVMASFMIGYRANEAAWGDKWMVFEDDGE